MGNTFVAVVISSILFVLKIVVPIHCVINGDPALRNEFASTVRLVFNSENNTDQPLCTGVIINQILILTAGHCLNNIQNLSTIEVIAGDYHRIAVETTEQRRQVVDNYSHPQMDYDFAMRYDLTILRLTKPLIFDEAVLQVSVPETYFDVKGDLIFAGWGVDNKTEEQTTCPDILQKLILQVVDTKSCKDIYKNLTEGEEGSFSEALCGFNVHKIATPWNGDSGGGAFCLNGSQKVLCGILSYAFDCHRSGRTMAVFSRIDEGIVEWIREIVNNTQPHLNDLLRKTDAKNIETDTINIIKYSAIVGAGIATIIIITISAIAILRSLKRERSYDLLSDQDSNNSVDQGKFCYHNNINV